LLRRGFTDHEHLDRHALIHMNGRIYDYRLGRFLGVDPIVQFPTNSQSLNAYSYVLNNPFSGTDPTGYAQAPAECVSVSTQGNSAGVCLSNGVTVAYGVKDGRVELAAESTMAAINASNGASIRIDTMPGLNTAGAHAIGSQAEMRATPYWTAVRMKADAFYEKYVPGLAPLASEINAGNERNMQNLSEGNLVAFAAGFVAARVGGTVLRRWFSGIKDKLVGLEETVAAKATVARNPNVYEALFEAPISGTTRAAHRTSANQFLANQLGSDAQLGGMFNQQLGGNVLQHMQSGRSGLLNPPGAVWHHPANNPNVMQLLRTGEHTAPSLQPVLHPGGVGGFGNFYGP